MLREIVGSLGEKKSTYFLEQLRILSKKKQSKSQLRNWVINTFEFIRTISQKRHKDKGEESGKTSDINSVER